MAVKISKDQRQTPSTEARAKPADATSATGTRSDQTTSDQPISNPATAGTAQAGTREALGARRDELQRARRQTADQLRAWREESEGFTSVSRVARATKELITGDLSARGFLRQAGDPEAYGESPLRLRMRQLEERIDLVDHAAQHLARQEPLVAARDAGKDLILDEIAAAKGVPLSRTDLVAHRAAHLERAVSKRDPQEALETYVALSALYLEAPAPDGDSVHRVAGQPSLSATVNGWVLTGRLRTRGPLVLTADDLARLSSRILKTAKQLEREGALPPGGPPITKETIAAEVERLRALETSPGHQQLLDAGVRQGHALLHRQTRTERLTSFGRGLIGLLDKPETYAMVLMISLAGHFGRATMQAVGSQATTAAEMDAMRRGSRVVWNGLRPHVEGPLRAKAVARFASARALEGAAFHTGMNLFDVARRKPERATWGLADYARSVALWEVLGGVHIWQQARHIGNAVTKHAATLGEETLGLSLLGLGEVYLQGGDGQDVLDLVESNLQFLLAMRLLSGARWARRGFRPEAQRGLASMKAEADRLFKQARRAEDPAAQAELSKQGALAWHAYAKTLFSEIQRLHDVAKTAATPLEAMPPMDAAQLPRAGLRAIAELFKKSPGWAEKVERGGGLFVPGLNLAAFADQAARSHEYVHRRFAALTPADLKLVMDASEQSGALPPIVEHAARQRRAADGSVDPVLALEEALGDLEADQLSPNLQGPMAQLLDAKTADGETVRDLYTALGLLAPEGQRAAWLREGARLRTRPSQRAARASEGAPEAAARIVGLTSPLQTATGLVDFRWGTPGDAIPFELTVETEGDPAQVRAELLTNANHNDAPQTIDAYPMERIAVDGSRVTFRAAVPIHKLGIYRASARVSADGGETFPVTPPPGTPELRFRPVDRSFDHLNFTEVNVGNVNCDQEAKRYGTFADMMEPGSPQANGKYTLDWLAAQHKNAIWLQPIFEVSKWEYRHPLDDAGSPYAVKDFFSVRTELSRAAQGLEGEAARDAALQEFRAFVKQAHARGIKVILDVALNHVGHNYDFRDLFIRYNKAGEETREVRRGDYSQVTDNLDPEQVAAVAERLADPKIPDYMEYIVPWMFGSTSRDPAGATSVDEKASGGWGKWHDVGQFNHGLWLDIDALNRGDYVSVESEPNPQNRAVRQYLQRVLRYWAVDMNVDGYRFDFLPGLPPSFVEEAVNETQADVDRHRPGKNLYLMGEDFHNVQQTQNYLDYIQGGWFRDLLAVHNVGLLESVLENPWFKGNLVNLSSHDEARFFSAFGEDWRGATRLGALLQLVGGPVAEVCGDEFGEKQQLLFKQYKDMPALREMDPIKHEIARTFARAGRTRMALASLSLDDRRWLRPTDGGQEQDLVALSRLPDADVPGEPVFVLANLANDGARENLFRLDEASAARIDPMKRYQIVDLMSDHPSKPLWDPPPTGRELLDSGLFVQLQPYQIQALALESID